MYSLLDREDYAPCPWGLFQKVSQSEYSGRARAPYAQMSRKTVCAAATPGPTASAPSSALPAVASGAAGTGPSLRTTCGPKSRPNLRNSSVGEQADYELDRLLCWGDTWWDENDRAAPRRAPPKGVKAPELMPADPMDFPLVAP